MCDHTYLETLGQGVAEDGPAAHEEALRGLARSVSLLLPGSAQVLADVDANDVARQRALAVASAMILRTGGTDRLALCQAAA